MVVATQWQNLPRLRRGLRQSCCSLLGLFNVLLNIWPNPCSNPSLAQDLGATRAMVIVAAMITPRSLPTRRAFADQATSFGQGSLAARIILCERSCRLPPSDKGTRCARDERDQTTIAGATRQRSPDHNENREAPESALIPSCFGSMLSSTYTAICSSRRLTGSRSSL